jgi:hypothetical protein
MPWSQTSPPSKTDPHARVAQNVQAVLALRAGEEGRLSRHQRLIERVTESLGRPRTI